MSERSDRYIMRDPDEAKTNVRQDLQNDASPSGEGGDFNFWSRRLDLSAASVRATLEQPTPISTPSDEVKI